MKKFGSSTYAGTGKRYLQFSMILDEEEDMWNHNTILLQGINNEFHTGTYKELPSLQYRLRTLASH